MIDWIARRSGMECIAGFFCVAILLALLPGLSGSRAGGIILALYGFWLAAGGQRVAARGSGRFRNWMPQALGVILVVFAIAIYPAITDGGTPVGRAGWAETARTAAALSLFGLADQIALAIARERGGASENARFGHFAAFYTGAFLLCLAPPLALLILQRPIFGESRPS